MKLRMIVATHKEYRMPADPLYLPVQAGRALHAPLPYIGDDSGLNDYLREDSYLYVNQGQLHRVADRILEALGADCLWVELASSPGGLPQGWKPVFSVLHAASLPGHRLPRSAAAALLEGIKVREGSL